MPLDLTIANSGTVANLAPNSAAYPQIAATDRASGTYFTTPAQIQGLTGNIDIQTTRDLVVDNGVTLTTAGQNLRLDSGNDLTVDAGIQAAGNLDLYAASPRVASTNPNGALIISAPVVSTGGNVILHGGTAGVTLDTVAVTAATRGTISIVGDLLTGANVPGGIGATNGGVDITPFTAGRAIELIEASETPTAGDLSISTYVLADIGSTTAVTAIGSSTAGGITIGKAPSDAIAIATPTLDLVSGAAIVEQGALSVQTLTGSAGGDASLTGANIIATLGAFATAGNLTLNDTSALTVIGTQTATGSVRLSDSGTITFGGGSMSAETGIAILAPSIAQTAAETLVSTGGLLQLDLTASGGTIALANPQNDISAPILNLSAPAGTIALDSTGSTSNLSVTAENADLNFAAVSAIGSVETDGHFSLTDGASLSIDTMVADEGSAITIADTGNVNVGGTGYVTESGSSGIVNLSATGTIAVHGTVSGVGGVMLSAGGTGPGTITNSGRIVSGGTIQVATGSGSLVNSGYISSSGASLVMGSGSTLVNAGTIAGHGNAATFRGAGADRVVLEPGGMFSGGVAGGSGTNTLELAGTAGQVGTLSNFGTQFSNFGTIAVDPGADWVFAQANTIGAGITLTDAGTLTNQGSIDTTVAVQSGTFTNAATGVITTGGYAVTGSGTVTVVNAGSISGSRGIDLVGGGIVTNVGSASLVAGAQGPGIFVSGGLGTVDNDGTVSGANIGVWLSSGGTLTNDATGSIQGAASGALIAGGAGTVTNAGTISGGSAAAVGLTASGTVTNAYGGLIAAVSNNGVYITGGLGVVVNDGTVASTATSAAAVFLKTGGTVTNDATGSIQGAASGVFVAGGAGTVTNAGTVSGRVGVNLRSGGTIANTGTASVIAASAGDGVQVTGGAGTVVDAGTISATSAAVRFIGTYADRLILDPGAVLQGAVVGQTGTAATNTLELAGTAGQVGTLSSFQTFTNFGTIAIDSGADWVFAQGNAIGAGVRLIDAGTLTNQGSIASTVAVTSGTFTNAPTGVVTASGYGVTGYGVAAVVNAGAITGRNGVDLFGGGGVTNVGTASLIAGTQGPGIFVSGGLGTVDNEGTVRGSNIGVWLYAGGTVTNTDTILGGSKGVYIEGATGTVVNSGSVSSSYGGILLTAGGSVSNVGTSSLIQDTGTTGTGVYIKGGAGTVVNAGTVSSSVNAINLRSGGTVGNVGTGSLIQGTGTAGTGVIIVGAAGTVTNAGTISAGVYGVNLGAGGTVGNTGPRSLISGGSTGVYVSGGAGTVVNAGIVSSSLNAINLRDGGTVGNVGTGSLIRDTGTAGTGVIIVGTAGTVTNAGTISAAVYGVILGAGGTVGNIGTSSLITNTGGTGDAILITNAAGTVSNQGTILAIDGDGVHLRGGGSISNEAGALIQGYDGVDSAGAVILINAGTILGGSGTAANGVLLAGGTASNAVGALIAGYTGVYASGASLILSNAGLISASGTSVISGAGGVAASDGATVMNTGTIEAASVGVYIAGGAATVTNTGTIAGAIDAVKFVGTFNDRLILDVGAVEQGAIVGQTGTGATDTLELGQGTLAGIGTLANAITGFGTIQVDTGASWSFASSNSIGAGVLLTDAGRLSNAGTIDSTVTLVGTAPFANAATGTITANGVGVYAQGASATVTNAGTIIGTTDAVLFTGTGANLLVLDAGAVTQGAIVGSTAAGATDTLDLAAGPAGVVGTLSSAVSSFGTVRVDPGADWVLAQGDAIGGGVLLTDAGTLTNQGSIGSTVTLLSGAGTFTNTGNVATAGRSIYEASGAGTVTNAGTIFGNTATVELLDGGTVSNTGFIGEYSRSSFTYTAIEVGGAAGVVTNTGTITGMNGILLQDGGVVDNRGTTGTIAASIYGIRVLNGTGAVANDGEIVGGTHGVVLKAGGSVDNSGSSSSIVGNYYQGVYVSGGAGMVTNAGTIDGVTGGVWLTDGGFVSNEGSSSSISAQSGVYISGAIGTVTNAGTIAGHYSGVELASGGSVDNSGTASRITGFAGVYVRDDAGTVTNAGTVAGYGQGVYLATGGFVSNTGTASLIQTTGTFHSTYVGRGVGVFVSGGTATVTNDGTISGNKDGVYLSAGGFVSNTGASGLIQTTGTYQPAYGGTYVGVLVAGGAGTVTNAGTISGATDAVEFVGTFDDRLILDVGAVERGAIVGQTGTAATNTLELAQGSAAGAGTLSGFSTQFTDFGTIQVDGSADWQFAATNTIGGGIVLTDSGTLANAGSIGSALTLLAGAAPFTNAATGTIAATGVAIRAQGGSATVVNAGMIAGTTDAVLFAGTYADRLILETGAVEMGALVGQGGTVGTTTLELAAGAAQAGTLSSAVTNFGTVQVDAGTSWTLGGAGQTLAAGVSLGSTLMVAASGTAAFTGALYGGGGLVVDGPAETDLLAAGGFAGGVALDAGALVVGNGAALGTGTLAMAQGTTLAFSGDLTIGNTIALAADPTFVVAGGQVETLTGPIADTSGEPAGVLEKTGAGTLVLDGDDNYSGGTMLDGGTLDLGTRTAAGLGAVTFGTGSGATLQIEAAALGADAGHTLASTLAGFTDDEAIDLRGIGTATASFDYADDVLTLSENGATVATLQFQGTYAGHAFLTRADGVGGTDVTLDATAQQPSVTARLADDTGSSSSDGITSDDTITGTGDPGQTVVLSENGVVVGSAPVGTDGTWSADPADLPQGAQTVTASESDLGETATAGVTFTYDTIPPTVSSPTLTVQQNAGPTAIDIAAPSDNLTSATDLAIVAGTLPSDGTITLDNGTTPVTTGERLTASELEALEFTPTPHAANQGSTFTYTVTDAAGNSSTGTAALDIGGPGAPSITGTHASSTSAEVPVDPFAGVAVADPSAATDTLTITLRNGGGMLAGSGLVANPDGTYTLSGSANQVTEELDGLSFTPNAPPAGTSSTTTFVLRDASSAGTSVSDAGTSVTDTAAPVPVADSITLDADPAFLGHGAFELTGTASSPAGVGSVEISAEVDGVETDLGAATLGANGTFAFKDVVGPHTQGFITATETDTTGGTASDSPSLSLEAGLGSPYVAREDHYTPSGDADTTSTLYRRDGSSTQVIGSPGQTVTASPYALYANHRQSDTTFVFDPGFGIDVVRGFKAAGPGHDIVDLPSADFTSLADVLRNTGDIQGSAWITDPVTGDAIRLAGVTTAELKAHPKDIAFHT